MLFNWFIHHCFCQLGRIFWAISTQRSVKATFEEWDCRQNGLCSETSIFSHFSKVLSTGFLFLHFCISFSISCLVPFASQNKFNSSGLQRNSNNLIKCWKVIIWGEGGSLLINGWMERTSTDTVQVPWGKKSPIVVNTLWVQHT